jgi:hypothetical protein
MRLVHPSVLAPIDIKRDLVALGIDPEDYGVLRLLPLVYVAWADGKMEWVERDRILQLAHERFAIGGRAALVLEGWLRTRPSLAYIRHGLRDLLGLALAKGELEIGVEELPTLLAHAETIARSTAAALDSPWAVTPEEEAALAEIAALLCVDNGVSWASVLRELDYEQQYGLAPQSGIVEQYGAAQRSEVAPESGVASLPSDPFPLVRRRTG